MKTLYFMKLGMIIIVISGFNTASSQDRDDTILNNIQVGLNKIQVGLSFDLVAMPGQMTPNSIPLPVSMIGTVVAYSSGSVEMQRIGIDIGDSKINGEFRIEPGKERPLMTGSVNSAQLDLRPVLVETTRDEIEGKNSKSAPVFSRENLPVVILHSVDANISLTLDRILLPRITLEKFQLPVTIHNYRLDIGPGTARAAKGDISFQLTLDGGRRPAVFNSDIAVTGLVLGDLPHPKDSKWLSGASTDVDIKLTGKGDSVAAIMAGLEGDLLVQTGPGTLPTGDVDLFGGELLISTFNRLSPFSREQDIVNLECAVIKGDIRAGVVRFNKGIAIMTEKMNMVGDGTINLGQEKLDLSFRPEARESKGFDFTGLAGLARVKGSLNDPAVSIDKKGALKAGASATAAVMTGGLSLLAQGIYNRVKPETEACKDALGGP